jgi:hypothetical protein
MDIEKEITQYKSAIVITGSIEVDYRYYLACLNRVFYKPNVMTNEYKETCEEFDIVAARLSQSFNEIRPFISQHIQK